jgi:hypothetical protein
LAAVIDAGDLMQREPIFPSQVVLRLLTLAITIVVGLKVGPELSAHGTSASVIGSADQRISEDAVRVGHRLEPRLFRAHFLDRLPAVRPAERPGVIPGDNEALALRGSAYEGRSDVDRLPLVKHVPRMERGDPPRT